MAGSQDAKEIVRAIDKLRSSVDKLTVEFKKTKHVTNNTAIRAQDASVELTKLRDMLLTHGICPECGSSMPCFEH